MPPTNRRRASTGSAHMCPEPVDGPRPYSSTDRNNFHDIDNIASQLSGSSDGRAGPEPLPLAVAGEDVSSHPALRRVGVSVGRIPGHHRDRRVRGVVHRPLSALTVRLQRRHTALELASRVLRLRSPGYRPLPAVHLVPDRLPSRLRRRLPRTSPAAWS